MHLLFHFLPAHVSATYYILDISDIYNYANISPDMYMYNPKVTKLADQTKFPQETLRSSKPIHFQMKRINIENKLISIDPKECISNEIAHL